MFSAPGWAVHNHASLDEDVYELTIQDSPLNIWMGSLLWQESLDQPIESLGGERRVFHQPRGVACRTLRARRALIARPRQESDLKS